MTRGRIAKLVLLCFCLVGLAWVVSSLGPRQVASAAARADRSFLALSLLAVLARYLVWGIKWWLMLNRRGPFGLVPALRALMAGMFVNLTTPTAKLGGGFLRAALVHRDTKWGLAAAYGWSFADQVTNSLGNVLLAGLVLPLAARALPPGALHDTFLVLGGLAIAGVLLLVSLRGWAWKQVRTPRVHRSLARLTPARFRSEGPAGPAADWVEPVLAPTLAVGSTWRVAPLDLGLAALSCLCLCASNAAALTAVGVHAPFAATAAATVLAGLAGTLVGTLGGVGATELALIGLFERMHFPAESAAAAALLHRAAYYAVGLVVGGAALAWESRWLRPHSPTSTRTPV